MKKKFVILIMLLSLIFIPKVGINEVKAEGISLKDEAMIIANYDTYYGSTDYYSYNSRDLDNDFNRFMEALNREDVAEAIAILLAAFAGIFIVLGLLFIGYIIYMIIVTVKIYKKAGKPGWTCIVPFYNTYILSEITWGKGWYSFIYIGVSILNSAIENYNVNVTLNLALTVAIIMTMYKLAKAFGKGGGFTCGLIFLNPIFMGILAFSNKIKYVGVDGSTNNFENLGITSANNKEENTANDNQNQAHFCPYCGSSIDNNHIFCGNCGSKLK